MMANKNKLIIASAGSGKTTFITNEALKISLKNVLITTYTEANEEEIKKKILSKKGFIPHNITVQTWFSFLLHHGVRPYQGCMDDGLFDKTIGFYLSDKQSGFRYEINGQPIYWGEIDFYKYYFANDLKIYSDKISKFVFECNKKSNNEVIKRLSRIYSYIFIDEIQDLAGWDLEILNLLFSSSSNILLVGDPRQVTYLTHHPKKYKKYIDGKIIEFIKAECHDNICDIDENMLKFSHRNNKFICDFSSNLYPNFIKNEPCNCPECRKYNPEHQGIFLIKNADVNAYCEKYKPVTKLLYQKANFPDLNFGASKGLSFDRVLIYPTDKILKYIKNGKINEIESVKAKFYVALTRAKYSVGIVCDYDDSEYIDGIQKYKS